LLNRYEFESVVISHAVCDLPYYHSPVYVVSFWTDTCQGFWSAWPG